LSPDEDLAVAAPPYVLVMNALLLISERGEMDPN